MTEHNAKADEANLAPSDIPVTPAPTRIDKPEEANEATAENHDEGVTGGDEAKQRSSEDVTREFIAHFETQSPDGIAKREKKLLLKIDLHLLPYLILMYLLNFLDRSNLAQARQGTLEKDLGMSGTDFNLATSIFFVGYLLMQLPSNMLITRVKPSIYLAGAMTLWGVVSTSNAAVQNFSSLVVVRFFLGFVEAPFFPGAIFLMSSWYTRAELTRRVSWFYSGNALANMFGGVIGASVLSNLEGDLGIAGWRWLFIIEGVITIGIALTAAFVLPNYPHTTRWLSEEEKAFASWRLLADINEADQRHSRSIWAGIKLALKDYRLPLFVLFQHLSLLTQTFQYFFPAIVQTLHFSPITALWLTAPVWFATFLTSVGVTWSSARLKDRSIHIAVLMVISGIGNAIATGTTNVGARFFAMFLMPMGAISAYTILVAWVANSFPRPLVKRSACIAIANMVGNTASIYGSYMYPSKDNPQYIPGGTTNTIMCFVVAGFAIVLRFLHIRENKKLERAEQEVAAQTGDTTPAAESYDPEKRALGFRYIT